LRRFKGMKTTTNDTLGESVPSQDACVPKLYETENAPLEKKIIHQRYWIEEIGFYWLIAELDRENNLAFGYANLCDDTFAEWGYIDVSELIRNGAVLDGDWKPCPFEEALKKIAAEKKEVRKK
jgi:hypothetical protein